MAHDVFISYSTEDQKIVEVLSGYLEQNGIRCFIAYRDIPKGIVWAEIVTEAIENCKLMVVVFSENFNSSKQVDREIEMAIEEGKTILTFKIQNTDFKGTKKYFLKNLNWIDAFPNPKEYFGVLLKSIQGLLPEIPKPENKNETKPAAIHKISIKVKKSFVYAGIATGIAIVCGAGILYLKNKTNPPAAGEQTNITIETKDEPIIETKDEPIVENKEDTVLSKKTGKQQPMVTEPVLSNPTHAEKPEKNPGYEKKQIVFTEKKTLTLTSGEQLEADEGDSFEGEFENGKVVSGKLYDKDKNIKKIILPKRNH